MFRNMRSKKTVVLHYIIVFKKRGSNRVTEYFRQAKEGGHGTNDTTREPMK